MNKLIIVAISMLLSGMAYADTAQFHEDDDYSLTNYFEEVDSRNSGIRASTPEVGDVSEDEIRDLMEDDLPDV